MLFGDRSVTSYPQFLLLIHLLHRRTFYVKYYRITHQSHPSKVILKIMFNIRQKRKSRLSVIVSFLVHLLPLVGYVIWQPILFTIFQAGRNTTEEKMFSLRIRTKNDFSISKFSTQSLRVWIRSWYQWMVAELKRVSTRKKCFRNIHYPPTPLELSFLWATRRLVVFYIFTSIIKLL